MSTKPIRALDDRACLRYLDLADSDDEVEHFDRKQAKNVSKKFSGASGETPAEQAMRRKSTLVDERLIELLEKMPKNKRISLRP